MEESNRSTYPDVTVVCTKQVTATDDADAIVNPTLIAEVLSESTEASDRGEKFAHLQRLASLQGYVLVGQHEQRVEVFRRGEGMWMLFTFTSGRVELKSLDVSLELADICANPLA